MVFSGILGRFSRSPNAKACGFNGPGQSTPPLPPGFHPISPKPTQSTQESAEGRNPTSCASISVVKELALCLQRARFFISYFIRPCQVPFSVEASKHLSVHLLNSLMHYSDLQASIRVPWLLIFTKQFLSLVTRFSIRVKRPLLKQDARTIS